MNFEDQALLAHLEEPEKFYITDDPKELNGYLTGLCQSAQERIIQLLEQVETQGKLLKELTQENLNLWSQLHD